MLLIRLNGTLAPVSTVNSAGVGAASWADSRPATAKGVASSGRIDIQNTPTFLAPRPRKDVPLYVGLAARGGLVTRLGRRLPGYPPGRAQLDTLPHNGTHSRGHSTSLSGLTRRRPGKLPDSLSAAAV